ncbi:MAG: uroporphyrinogen-III C-methyltransferase, partial [Alphaproteobacteria bacterium]|nr:uroporphyrinogen-III C-methyltransferase [Alphaproteobacteria bacterium]
AAKARDIPCNCVDKPGLSTFIMPSIVDRSPVIVAIGTEGTAPVLGQGIRAAIEAMLPVKIGQLASAAARLRSRVAKALPAGRPHRDFWRQFFFGPAREAFLAGDVARHDAIVETLIAGDTNTAGNVVFVSAGNGEPEFLTLKAHRLLQEADVIVHDEAMPAAVLEFARRDATRHPARPDDFTTTADLLLAEVRKGRRVIRLHLGAVSIEERAAVAAEAIAVEVVPGVAAPRSAELLSFRQRAPRVIEPLKAAS